MILLAFSLTTNAREHTIFGGLALWDTETFDTQTTGEEFATGVTVTTGSRAGFGFFYQSFEDDSFFLGAGFQRTEGEYDVCILGECISGDQTVNDMNLELGWTRNNWTPFLDFIWSDIETDDSDDSDTDNDLELGVGFWYKPSAVTRLKFSISGLRNDENQILNSGFQRTLENDVTIGGTLMYVLNEDNTGYGYRFTVGWTL